MLIDGNDAGGVSLEMHGAVDARPAGGIQDVVVIDADPVVLVDGRFGKHGPGIACLAHGASGTGHGPRLIVSAGAVRAMENLGRIIVKTNSVGRRKRVVDYFRSGP